MENRFQALIDEIKKCDGSDPEVEHTVADAALCAALLIAAGDEAKPLIEAWSEVGKWFA